MFATMDMSPFYSDVHIPSSLNLVIFVGTVGKMSNVISVKIPNWSKFNPRSDRANYTWFRLENNFFSDQELFGLGAIDKLVLLFVLCEASKKNKDSLKLNLDYVSANLRLPVEAIHASLLALKEIEAIKFESLELLPTKRHQVTAERREHSKLPQPNSPLRTYERTNETNVYAGGKETPKTAEVKMSLTSRVRDAYLESFKKEFNRDYPGWGAKENAQAAAWLRSVSIEQAMELCWLYPKWNDPWVTEQGHPFGILVTQYVKLDAWAKSTPKLIEKIAQGRAARKVELDRESEREEMRRGVESRANTRTAQSEGSRENISDRRSVSRQLQDQAEAGLPGIPGNPFGEEIFAPTGSRGHGEGN